MAEFNQRNIKATVVINLGPEGPVPFAAEVLARWMEEEGQALRELGNLIRYGPTSKHTTDEKGDATENGRNANT